MQKYILYEHFFQHGYEEKEGTPSREDPFDRILLAHAKGDGMTLLTHEHTDTADACVRAKVTAVKFCSTYY